MDNNNLFFEIDSKLSYEFAAADTDQGIWSKTLNELGIKFKVLKTARKSGWEYSCVIIRVSKKDKDRIPEVAKRVSDTLAVLGFKDYSAFMGLLRNILNNKEEN